MLRYSHIDLLENDESTKHIVPLQQNYGVVRRRHQIDVSSIAHMVAFYTTFCIWNTPGYRKPPAYDRWYSCYCCLRGFIYQSCQVVRVELGILLAR